jgi:UPF0755 protein
VILGVIAFRFITSQADITFGPVSPHLSISQRFLLSWNLLQSKNLLTTPADKLGSDISFQINLGESPISVANRLEAEGVIPDARSFRNYLVYAGLDTQIQAGNYSLSPASSTIQIAHSLLDATPSEIPFVVLAGWRVEEIADSLPSSGLKIQPELFLNEVQNRGLEGYLFPGTYTVPRTISTEGLIDILVTAFEAALTPEIKDGFTKQGLTVSDGVKLASIIEREAVIDSEKPLIASVFLNRLAIGMKLESDPTVQYSIGFNQSQATWWTNPISISDLNVHSEYNTYRYSGLPPGPICNPSLESLRAVALPAKTPYYYFRATCDGSGQHNFSETYEEHLQFGCPK